MAEEATGEAAVPEDSGDEFQEDAEEQGLEDEDLEEEEPEDDEEIAPGPGGGASKNDTLDMLADMSDLSGFGASGKSASASHSRRAGSFSRVGGAGSATASRRSAEDSRHEDAEDVVLAREAVKWLLQKIYRRCDNSKLDKVPELMTRCEGKEVLLLHSALLKYVPMPRDEEIDCFGQTLEDKADLLQELLMGLADHFSVDAPAVDLSNLGTSFLQELYQMLSHVKESRLRPIDDAHAGRPEERSYFSGPSEGVLGSFVPDEGTGIPDVPDKDCEIPLDGREQFLAAAKRRHEAQWESEEEEEEGDVDGSNAIIEEPVASPAPDSRTTKRQRVGGGCPRHQDPSIPRMLC